MTILVADSSDLIAGSLITEVVSPDGRYLARRGLTIPGWVITLAGNPGPIVRVYGNAPGMNALVAMRRYLAERGRDSIGRCDSCDRTLYRGDDIVTQPVTIAGESNAATWQMCRACAEGEG